MIALLANWRVLAAAGIVAAAFFAGWFTNGNRWEAKFNASEAQHETDRADTNREARRVLEEAFLRERAEQRRIEDEDKAAILAVEERAEGIASRLKKTEARLAAAMKGDPVCSAQASQPLACPHSWQAAAPP